MNEYCWISYAMQNLPGNTSFSLDRHRSLQAAILAYVNFCVAVGTDECSMTLYHYTPEGWRAAEEMRDAGCPFDYPDKVIERGPSGGIRMLDM